ELTLRDAGRAEGIGLDDVRARFEKAAVNIADHLRLREREEVAVIEKVLLSVLESLAAHVGFVLAVGADGRAHRAVNNGNAVGEYLGERMLAGSRHTYLMSSIRMRCARSANVAVRGISALLRESKRGLRLRPARIRRHREGD